MDYLLFTGVIIFNLILTSRKLPKSEESVFSDFRLQASDFSHLAPQTIN